MNCSALCRTLLLCSTFALSQSPNVQPSKGQIEGTVVSAVNGQLLPHALIVLRTLKKNGETTLGRADDNARFLFDGLEAGSYQVSAGRPGYFTDERKAAMQPVVDVAAGEQVKDVVVRLLPLGVISGRIVDESNEVLRGVEVRLLAVEHYRGREFLNTMGSAISDDRGEYRIFDIRPGSYLLLAELNLSRKLKEATGTLPRRGSSLDIAYPPLLYPGTSDLFQAQKIVVNAGDDLHADFSLFPIRAVSIQGRVVNGLTGRPITSPMVTAYWGQNATMMARTAEIIANSYFEIRGIGAGTYTLHTTFVDDGENFSDGRVVEIGNEGTRNLVIAALPDFEFIGHVRLENARYAAFNPSVEFASTGGPKGTIFRVGTTRPDYQFVGKLHPGDHYRVNLPNLPQDFYLKSVRVGGREVPSTDVMIGARHTEIELLVSPAGGHIEGTTLNDKKEPVRGSYLLLVPDFTDKVDADLIRTARADVKGKFVLRGIAPGTYQLFAFEDVELSGMINQPDLLKNYEQNSQSVKVEEGGKYTVEIKPVPMQTGQ